MTMTFLAAAADKILAKHRDHLERLNIISPNRRALLFLQRIISQKINKPVWSPRILTIDDLVRESSTFERADGLTLNFELFKVWQNSGSQYLSDRFDRFYFWGQILLTDFDDIDKNLIDAERLFQILVDEKELDMDVSRWSEDEQEMYSNFLKIFTSGRSNLVSSFENIWKNLGQVYLGFREHLGNKKLAYNGMMYREVAGNLDRFSRHKDEHFIFLGFNRLNACEQKILEYFRDNLQAEFYWNSDQYLINHRSKDAGKFLVANLQKFPDDLGFSTVMDKERKNIRIIQSPFLSGQAQVVANTVYQIQSSTRIHRPGGDPVDDTLVLLPNESILPLLMKSVPESIGKINISLGLPVSATSIFRLLEAWIRLHAEAMENEGKLYYRDIENLILHPYLSGIFHKFEAHFNSENEGKKLSWNKIKQKIYIHYGDIVPDDADLSLFFSKPDSDNFFEKILKILEWLYNGRDSGYHPGVNDHDKEILAFTHKKFMLLRDIFKIQQVSLDFKNLLYLVYDIFRLSRLPFRGEPLTGLQILGTMEARNLGFSHVIIPSVEEGYLPAPVRNSFIPFNIRKLFFFPDRTEDAAEQAYYFYSTLQQASDVTLIYSQMNEGLGGKEKSRFIQQLLFWQNSHFKNWNITEKTMKLVLRPGNTPFKDLTSDKEIERLYHNKLSKGISASALNDFIDCRLRFYFKHVRNWQEDRELSEDMDAANFGSSLHKAMELIYQDFINRNLTEEDISELAANIDKYLEPALTETTGFDPETFQRGSNLFFRKTLADYIQSVLEYDRRKLPFKLIRHEYPIRDYPLKFEGIEAEIKAKGFIDRIDEKYGFTNIVDYKTGVDEKIFRNLDDLFDPHKSKRPKAIFQILFYTYVAAKEEIRGENFSAELYLVREMSKDRNFDARVIQGKDPYIFNKEEIHTFESLLSELFRDILDKGTIPKTDKIAHCIYCPYAKICKRDIGV